MRRVLCTLPATVGAMAFAVAPTHAGDTYLTFYSTSASYTDLREPTKNFTAGHDAPVGAWKDEHGRTHSSKAYYTFDLTPYQNAKFLRAEAWAPETEVTDCAKPISTELWLTDDLEKPTWLKAPAERVQHKTVTMPGCPWSRVEWDVTKTLNDAIAAGETKVTFALRMADRRQFDAGYGRRYGSTLAITTNINRFAHTPTGLRINSTECTPGTPTVTADRTPSLGAVITDPDGYHDLRARFELWNVNDPAQRREIETDSFSGGAGIRVPEGFFQDGQTYDWTLRAIDGDHVTAPAAPCRIVTDFTAPTTAPTVSSTFYPENGGPPGTGGATVPGEFTFTAHDPDVVRFEWWTSASSGTAVPAQPGGSAKVMITPGAEGAVFLHVHGYDRAGHRSPERIYPFYVTETAPEIIRPSEPLLGAPTKFEFRPRTANVVEYTYRYNSGAETTVQAAGDGSAEVILPITRPLGNTLEVRSKTRDGFVSATARTSVGAAYSVPEVTQDGDVFTFSPRMYGVTRYEYRLDGEARQEVAAGPGGIATVTIPHGAGDHDLEVTSYNAEGLRSDTAWHWWAKD